MTAPMNLPWISVGRCPQFPCTNLSFVQGDQQKKHGYSFMLEVMLPAPWCCGNGQLAGQVIGTTHCCLLAKKAMWMDTLRHQVPRTLELNTPFLFVLAIRACPGRPYALTLNFIFNIHVLVFGTRLAQKTCYLFSGLPSHIEFLLLRSLSL